MNITQFAKQLNAWGQERVPFLFMVDFEMEKPMAMRLDQIDPRHVLFDINGFTNSSQEYTSVSDGPEVVITSPSTLGAYKEKFDRVYEHLAKGDTYLTNLTIRNEVKLSHGLRELFFISAAKYKLFFNDAFLVFSPETFVRIMDGRIFSYPMKGTIDATLPGAREIILRNEKEMAEHVTIVDLIRNDLSQVAEHVQVTRFRYVDEIRTNTKNLLQVSSEISGDLPVGYKSRLGDIMVKLLPAGSVSGAPKQKTVDIIRSAEEIKRGYYTGVFGYFDGAQLDSGVMIRFIEKSGDQFFYRSGGGITTQSAAEDEYREAIDKVYVPLN